MKKLFLCTCNKTLTQTLDFDRIQKELGDVFDSIHTHDALCLHDGLAFIGSETSHEDSVVIGACTSQIIGPPLAKHIKSDMKTIVPLREQVAWVHKDDPKGATNKAMVLLKDGAIQVNHMAPPTAVELHSENRVLVVGGCIAGLRVVSDLVRLGIEVVLLEPPEWTRENYIEAGQFMAESKVVKDTVRDLLSSCKKVKRIQGSVTELSGRAGQYTVTLKTEKGKDEQILVGSIVISTASTQEVPSIAKMCHYGKSDRTLVISELTDLLSKQPAGQRMTILVATDPSHHQTTVEGSYLLRNVRMAAEKGHTVILAHSDISTKDEDLYRSARRAGVIFVRGSLERVKKAKDGMVCRLENTMESQVREFKVDYLVLQTHLGPWSGTARLASVLDVDLDQYGFIKTRYAKMKPVQTSRRGIFIAGCGKMPMRLEDALVSASNASLEVLKEVRKKGERRGWIPVVDEERCDVCEACINVCPNHALRLVDGKVTHVPLNCEFCGICVSVCPTRAIEFQAHSKESLLVRLEEIAKNHKTLEGQKPFSLVYACSECANASIDQAGFTGKGYPTGSYVIQFPCAGMVSPIEILKGLAVGAERVTVAHCMPGGCHHQTGDRLSELVVEFTREMLRSINQDPERVRATYMIAAQPNKMQEEVAHRG
ncbi:MAG: hypothetical protein DRP09_05595 [Candidatus Thorarchaeota archaeon]|nr:MAG: hypothetical protein DRP09_05595 [Candidatus Thorarchaeota archaeon]